MYIRREENIRRISRNKSPAIQRIYRLTGRLETETNIMMKKQPSIVASPKKVKIIATHFIIFKRISNLRFAKSNSFGIFIGNSVELFIQLS